MSDNERLDKALDSIFERLASIEDKLTRILVLESKVSDHTERLDRQDAKLNTLDERLRKVELWQASCADNSILKNQLTNLTGGMTKLEDKVDTLESKEDIYSGRSIVKDSFFKWGATIAGSVIVILLAFIAIGKT